MLFLWAVWIQLHVSLFIFWACDLFYFFCTLLHVWSLLRVFVQVRNPTCPYCLVRCTTLIGLCDFVLFLRHFFHSVCFLFIPDCACVCTGSAHLQACISQVCVCASMYVCVYNPRPFNSTTWIHPISRSPWLPGPLITEGPGRSNRCASWLCVSSTTVARNLCCMQHTGACHLWRKPAWAQKHCRDVLVWSGECVCVCVRVLVRNSVRFDSSERFLVFLSVFTSWSCSCRTWCLG